MLILSRRVDETIVIDENITVQIIAIENGQVKLGIAAPRSVPVVRGELIDAVAKENIQAQQGSQANAEQALLALQYLEHKQVNAD